MINKKVSQYENVKNIEKIGMVPKCRYGGFKYIHFFTPVAKN